jgi:lysozyme family protein
MTTFARALELVRTSECHPACVRGDHARCFTHHPDDPGGATCCGIIQRTYDGWRRAQGLPVQPVQHHTPAEREAIYLERFWTRAACDRLPWPVALVHFDCAVNIGTEPRRPDGGVRICAGHLLQRALGVAEDGVVGPVTLAAAQAGPIDRLAYRYLLVRVFYYDSLDAKRPELTQFLTGGWLGRLRDLYREIG